MRLEQLEHEHLDKTSEAILRDRMRDVNMVYASNALHTELEMHSEVIRPALQLSSGHSLLEIGVPYGNHLASYRGLDYVGLDVDMASLEKARENALYFEINPDNIRLRTGMNLPFEDSSFDAAMAICTLHETKDPNHELSEMYRVVKPEGRLLIVERMCALEESPEAKANLRKTPSLLRQWFKNRDCEYTEQRFKATYWGESLVLLPQFNFYLFCAQKPEE